MSFFKLDLHAFKRRPAIPSMNNDVVITGAGAASSLGLTSSATWNALIEGKTGITPITAFASKGFGCNAAARVKGLAPETLHIHPRDSRIMEKHSYMLIKCSRDAMHEAGVSTELIPPESIGYFAGMGMVDYRIEDLLPAIAGSLASDGSLDYDAFFTRGYPHIHPLWPLSMLNNISFCQAAIDLGIRGENSVFCPHADSGMQAVIEGYHCIREDRARIVLAGGVSETVSPASMARAALAGILAAADSGSPLCRPFSSTGIGTVPGEGCAIIALESAASASERGKPALARITGYGSSFQLSEEGRCPTASAISRSMETALTHAGLDPSGIDVIIAHGDGTAAGDAEETTAIRQTFGSHSGSLVVYTSKGALGHLLAGSPAVDIVLGTEMLRHGIIPPVLTARPLRDDINFRVACDHPYQRSVRRILINAMSYEGQCCSLIIESPDN